MKNPCLAIPKPLMVEDVLPKEAITWRRFIGPKLPLHFNKPQA